MEAFETDESAPTHVPSPRRRTVRMSIQPQTPMSATAEALIVEYASTPTPPSPLSPLSSPLPQIPSPPLPLPSPPTTSPTYAEAPLGYKAAKIQLRAASPSIRDTITTLVGESSAVAAARYPVLGVATVDATLRYLVSREVGYGIEDVWDDMVGDMEERAPTTVEGLSLRVTDLSTTLARDTHEIHVNIHEIQIQTWDTRIGSLETLVATLVAQTSSLQTQLTTALGPILHSLLSFMGNSWLRRLCSSVSYLKMPPKKRTITTTTTTPMTDAQLKALIAQGVADALAEIEANRTSRNGDDSHDLGTGSRRTERATRECTYIDFLKCQPMNVKGTKGVVGLTQWFEKMESVFHISNCTVACQIKFAPCKIKRMEIEVWNLKVKGTDVESYSQRFQELALMCSRMFPEESDEVEKYVGGLPNMIQGSVMVSKPKKIQDAIEFVTELMDQKICTLAECQAKNKRKFEDTSRNNQN
ncbi:hypothetical protein Tco_1376728 [Tanacetum coccineum]